LGKKSAFGNDQAGMLDALETDLTLHGAEWEALGRILERMRPTVRQHVEYVIQETIMGDKVMGDKFENIKDATIINRSTVQNSFTALNEAALEDVRRELEEMLHKVEETGSPEAAEVAEAFVEESGGARRKTVLTGLWDRLRELAPVVGGLATAGTAIGKVLLGLP
jgi:hypothetical protein